MKVSNAKKWLRIGWIGLGLLSAWGLPSVAGDAPATAAPTAEAAEQNGTTPLFELDPDRQEKVWDAEHIVFKLERYVFKPMAKAFADNDLEAAQRFFHQDARFRLPKGKAKEQVVQAGRVQERRLLHKGRFKSVDGPTALRDWLSWRDELDRIDINKFRILFLERVGRLRSALEAAALPRGLRASPPTARPVGFVAEMDAQVRFPSERGYRAESGRLHPLAAG